MKEEIKQYPKDNPDADHFDIATRFNLTLIDARVIMVKIKAEE